MPIFHTKAFQLRPLSAVFFALTLLCARVSALSPVAIEGFTYVKTVGEISEYTLDSNGLQVLLMPENSAPVLTFMVTYRVGSRNEVTGTTGATHLLEHLMFKGTDRFHRQKGTGIDQLLEQVGAMYNATTSRDRTNYYANLDSNKLAMVMEVEADRMRNLLLKEEDRRPEMTVVRNEFEQGENQPMQALLKEILQAAYVAHPYHHSVIGWRSDIEKVSIDKLREFYDTFYWPDNSTVTIIGAFEIAEALELIKKHYGRIPRSPKPIPDVYTEEPKQTYLRRVGVKRAGQLGVIGVGHKIPAGTHPDFAPLSVLSSILCDGKNSRLYRGLTDKGLTAAVQTYLGYNRDPSIHVLFASLTPGTTHEQAESALLAELERLKKDGVTDQEVSTAINKILADAAFQRDGSFAIAENLNENIAIGDWTAYYGYEERIQKVTPADIKRVANKYLVDDQSTIGWFVPVAEEAGAGGATALPETPSRSRLSQERFFYRDPSAAPARVDDATNTTTPAVAPSRATKAVEFSKNVLSERVVGINLLQYKTGVKDVVTIRGSLPAGDAFSPADNPAIATLVGNLLDKGTTRQDKFAISQLLESVGATVNFSVTTYNVQISAQCLSKDVPLVVSLIAEMLRTPAFSPDEFTKLKKQLSGSFQRALEDPDFRANEAFTQAVYPVGHPHRETSVADFIASIERATLDQIKAFHAKHYGPKNMTLVAVGDLDTDSIRSNVASSFNHWSGGVDIPTAPVVRPRDSATQAIQMADKSSVAVVIGQATGLKYTDPDFHAVRLGTAVLGSGFTGRLMATVRDQEGLTYGINSAHTNETYNPGQWAIYTSFAPELLARGIESTQRELNRWYKEGITKEELEHRKGSVIGSFKVNLATTTGLAEQLLINAQRGNDPSFLDRYPGIIEALTVDQINAAIKRHLNPNTMVQIQAGTLPTDK